MLYSRQLFSIHIVEYKFYTYNKKRGIERLRHKISNKLLTPDVNLSIILVMSILGVIIVTTTEENQLIISPLTLANLSRHLCNSSSVCLIQSDTSPTIFSGA